MNIRPLEIFDQEINKKQICDDEQGINHTRHEHAAIKLRVEEHQVLYGLYGKAKTELSKYQGRETAWRERSSL